VCITLHKSALNFIIQFTSQPLRPAGSFRSRHLAQPGEEQTPGRPYRGLPVLKRACKKAGEGPFAGAYSDRTRGDGFKLKEGRFRLDIRKKFFTLRVVRPWHGLPREAVAAPSLAVFKARLDGALSNLVWWKMSLLMAGGLEPDDL